MGGQVYWPGEEANERIRELENSLEILERTNWKMARQFAKVIADLVGRCREAEKCRAGWEVSCKAWNERFCWAPEIGKRTKGEDL